MNAKLLEESKVTIVDKCWTFLTFIEFCQLWHEQQDQQWNFDQLSDKIHHILNVKRLHLCRNALHLFTDCTTSIYKSIHKRKHKKLKITKNGKHDWVLHRKTNKMHWSNCPTNNHEIFPQKQYTLLFTVQAFICKRNSNKLAKQRFSIISTDHAVWDIVEAVHSTFYCSCFHLFISYHCYSHLKLEIDGSWQRG